MEPFWEQPWGDQPRFNERPWECDPAEAQRYLNVPLLWPDEETLPEGTAVQTLTVRPEGEEKWSSARLVIEGGGRRLRLKQYLFDWWRPTELCSGLQQTLGFYRAGERVVAWGRDYTGRSAACTRWGPTTVELRIERGTFVEIELRRLLAGLSPAVPEALALLTAARFPMLSYHARRGYGPRHLDELAAAAWCEPPEAIIARSPVPVLVPRPLPAGWHLDAASLWPDPPPQESQWLLRDEQGAIAIYARARPTADRQPLKLPAIYRVAEGWRARQRMLRRRRATVARQHPDLGGWSAAWAEGGARYQLFISAGALPGERAFRDLIESLVPLAGTR